MGDGSGGVSLSSRCLGQGLALCRHKPGCRIKGQSLTCRIKGQVCLVRLEGQSVYGLLDDEMPRLGWGPTNLRTGYWNKDCHFVRLQLSLNVLVYGWSRGGLGC